MSGAAVIIICGVSGCGKSTLGQAVAEKLKIRFVEGDDHHPESNIEKMSSGQPLTDMDRTLWLDSICTDLDLNSHQSCVLACSALTPYVQNYFLERLGDRVTWVKIDISRKEAAARMAQRDHFMPVELLDSQFEAWQPPKGGLTVEATNTAVSNVISIVDYLSSLGS